jgi:hypothetical protein
VPQSNGVPQRAQVSRRTDEAVRSGALDHISVPLDQVGIDKRATSTSPRHTAGMEVMALRATTIGSSNGRLMNRCIPDDKAQDDVTVTQATN